MDANQELFSALLQLSSTAEKPREIEFRVYYDKATGEILSYSTDDLPWDYIVVSQEVFHQNRYDRKVEDGVLKTPVPLSGKLRPAVEGTPCHPKDVAIINTDTQRVIFWKYHTYEN